MFVVVCLLRLFLIVVYCCGLLLVFVEVVFVGVRCAMCVFLVGGVGCLCCCVFGVVVLVVCC